MNMRNPRTPGRPGMSRGGPPQPPGRPGLPGRGGAPAYRARPQAADGGKMPLMLGVGGGLLAIILVIVVMSSGGDKPVQKTAPPPAPPVVAAPKPVDVSGLEREGRNSCEEGLAIIQSLEPRIAVDTATLSDDDQRKLKGDIKKGLDLLKKGLEYFGEANEKSGRTYDLNRYIQAKKLASNKYLGLKD